MLWLEHYGIFTDQTRISNTEVAISTLKPCNQHQGEAVLQRKRWNPPIEGKWAGQTTGDCQLSSLYLGVKPSLIHLFAYPVFSFAFLVTSSKPQKKKNPRKVKKKKKKLFSLNDSTKCNKAEANLSTEGCFSPLKWDFPARCKDAIVVARW